MDEIKPKWVEDLKRVHNGLPIDQTFKERLRKELQEQDKLQVKKRRKLRMWGALTAIGSIAAAAAVLLIINLVSGPAAAPVSAAALQLELQFNSSKTLGYDTSTSASFYNEASFYAIPGDGIYKQEDLAYTRLTAGNISELALAPSGKQLAYIQENELYIYDLSSKKARLAAAAERGKQLAAISWSRNEQKIAFAVTEPGSTNSSIMEVRLKTGEQSYLAEGTAPSYMADGQQLLYEHNGLIEKLDIETKETAVWKKGRSPHVSPNGQYVLYVKSGGNPEMEDVWISDVDQESEQKVTANEPVDAWKNGKLLEDGSQQPYFRVGHISWSYDGQQIGIYQIIETNVVRSQLVRYSLSEQALTPAEVAGKSIEALIYRDERYAHSFFSYDPGYLKGTSPRQVSYSILNEQQDEQGRFIITANIDYAYQFPFYSVSTMRFVVTDHAREQQSAQPRYLIDDMTEIGWATFYTSDDDQDEIVQELEDQQTKSIVRLADVPKDEGWRNRKFEHFVYRESKGKRELWLLVEQQGIEDAKSRHRLLRYNVDKQSFKPLAAFARGQTTSMMLLNEAADRAAITLGTEGQPSDIAVISWQDKGAEQEGKTVYLSELLQSEPYLELAIRMWKGSSLSFFAAWENHDVFMEYKD